MEPYKKVVEASYLTADKVWSYRAILHYFYKQHERMREFIFPEEVFAYLKDQPGFERYTFEELQQDLDQLVKWNNLIATQDPRKARTIEEFKRKRFRYQCTPYTVEFERMLEQMEKSGEGFGGSLEKKEFERLYQSLGLLHQILTKGDYPSDDECSQIWNDLFGYFRTIVKNTSDYMAYLNSVEVEERMQSESFLVYKDQFTAYLRDFIIGLQQTAQKIKAVLQEISLDRLTPFIQRVVAHQLQIPRFDGIQKEQKEKIDELKDKWLSLHSWFLGNAYGESVYEELENRTNEQIRRITRIIQRLGERHHLFRSRKRDYLHLAKWFDSLENLEEAHRLSAVVFGVFHTRHFYGDQIPTDNIHTDVWEEEPIRFETKPKIRNYREKTKAGAIESRKDLKEKMREAYLREKRLEQQAIGKYMRGNEIRLEEIPFIESHVRKMFLTWISKATARADRVIKTEHGRTVKVHIAKDRRILLRSDDGVLEMPAITFQFLDADREEPVPAKSSLSKHQWP